MTCQSSESTDAVETNRRVDDNSRAVESDESRIALAMKDLRNTGWYWGSLTASEAREVLQDAAEGTFLVRDSSQRDYLFTISAMTSAGPTNLRIEYKHGKFKLDSVVLMRPKLKQFNSVVHLVEHYVTLSRTHSRTTATAAGAGGGGGATAVTADAETPDSGALAAPHNGMLQLLLIKPVYTATPSLQHLCRVTINCRTKQVQDLPLPNRLKDYLMDYTYNV